MFLLHLMTSESVFSMTLSLCVTLVSCFNVNPVTENYGDLRKTPLFFAISNGDATCAEILLAAGAKTDLDPLRCILVALRAER